MTHRILVVEDDPALRPRLVRGLRKAGYEVESEDSGDSAIARLRAERFDLLVLDLMLPGADGEAILRMLRSLPALPVIVVSAKSQLDTRLQVFELGAIDFVPKPFWMQELVSRVRLRLGEQPKTDLLCWGKVEVNIEAAQVQVEGRDLKLTPSERGLLFALLRAKGRVLSREQLAEILARGDVQAAIRTIDSHLSRLRQKLGDDGAVIETVRGLGYRFQQRDEA